MLNEDTSNLTLENYPLKKSLLRESLIRVDYEDIIELDNNIIFEIEKFLNKYNFKIKKQATLGEIQFEINLDKMVNLDPTDPLSSIPIEFYNARKVLIFEKKDVNLIMNINPLFTFIQQRGSFVNETPKYAGFDYLAKILSDLLSIISDYKTLDYTRIGIRKINSQFTEKKNTIKDCFHPILVNDINFFPKKLYKNNNPRVEKLYNYKLNNFNVNLRTLLQIMELVNPQERVVKTYNFNYDIDTYITKQELQITQDNLYNILNDANKSLFSIFLWCLKEKTRLKLVNNEFITEIHL